MSVTVRLTLLCCALALGACSNDASKTSQPAAAPPPANVCTDPRPEICTQEYIGVCATLADGSSKTYATGCTACGDPQVVGWRLGECG